VKALAILALLLMAVTVNADSTGDGTGTDTGTGVCTDTGTDAGVESVTNSMYTEDCSGDYDTLDSTVNDEKGLVSDELVDDKLVSEE